MSIKKIIIVVLVLAVTMLQAGCEKSNENSNEKSSFYENGRKTGTQIVISAWDNLGKDCAKLSDLENIIDKSLSQQEELASKSEGSAKEFAQGYSDGMKTELKTVRDKCK